MNLKLFFGCGVILLVILLIIVVQNTLLASAATSATAMEYFPSSHFDELEAPNDKKKKNTRKKKNKTSKTKNKINNVRKRRGGPKTKFKSSAKSFGKSGGAGIKNRSQWRIKKTIKGVRSGGRNALRRGFKFFGRRLNPLSLLLFF